MDDMEWNPFRTEFLWKPWSHGSVYFIGLAFGYLVHNIRPKVLSNVVIQTLVYFNNFLKFNFSHNRRRNRLFGYY